MIEDTLKKLDALWEKSVQGTMSDPKENRTGDLKRAFMSPSGNDGWRDLRIEVDTDDCDFRSALDSATFLMALWNAWPELRKAVTSKAESMPT